jgi:hypothetical protein
VNEFGLVSVGSVIICQAASIAVDEADRVM